MAETIEGTATELRSIYLDMSDVKLQEKILEFEDRLKTLAETPALWRQRQEIEKLLSRVRFEELSRGHLDNTELGAERADRIAFIARELGTRAHATTVVEGELESSTV